MLQTGSRHSRVEGDRLYNVVPGIIQFIDDLTNWYIRRSRRRFWKSENDQDKNCAYATLYRVLTDFSRVLAPFLPFLAEEIYQILVREVDKEKPESVHLCEFPTPDPGLESESLVSKMSLAREAVGLGRVLRAQKKVKNRQPLASLSLAVDSSDKAEALNSLQSLIMDELNVKKVVITLDESGFVKFGAKANFKVLGRKMGKNMKSVAQNILGFTHDDVKILLDGGSKALEEGKITREDILITREVKPGIVVEAGNRVTVALDTVITRELLLEGLARDCVNKIQNTRKESGFSVTDRIQLTVFPDGDDIKEMFREHQDYIESEVLAETLIFSENKVDLETLLEYNGQIVSFSVRKAD